MTRIAVYKGAEPQPDEFDGKWGRNDEDDADLGGTEEDDENEVSHT